ncbi:MAG: hypothetical protein KC444_03910 [Nitrosopumilus sp.]|nr:hypothetical protein [Nitrosopumilus sp.]
MRGTKQKIMHNTQVLAQNMPTSVSRVECYICGKGLEEGHSISAKTLPNGIVLFCDIHCSLQ